MEQARFPLLSPFEMANASTNAIVDQAMKAGYGERLRGIYGEAVLGNREAIFDGILEAFNADLVEFGPDRLEAVLSSASPEQSAEEIAALILAATDDYSGTCRHYRNCSDCECSRPLPDEFHGVLRLEGWRVRFADKNLCERVHSLERTERLTPNLGITGVGQNVCTGAGRDCTSAPSARSTAGLRITWSPRVTSLLTSDKEK